MQLPFFKTCPNCDRSKFVTEFYKNKAMKDGLGNVCKDCQKAYNKNWAENNPEHRAEINKKSSLKNRDKRLEKNKARYRATPIEKIRAKAVLYREKQREVMKRYRAAHPDKVRELERKRRALENSSTGNFTQAEFKELCVYYGNICLCCRKSMPLVADHVIPLIKGGSNSIENIQPLCFSCNAKKYTKTIDYRE